MKIGFIGGGPISDFHVEALKNNGFKITAIGSRPNSSSCLNFANNNNLQKEYCSGGWEEVVDKEVDAYCICVDVTATHEILLKALEKSKPILVEKPIAWDYKKLKEIIKHKNSSNIFVGYNRRYYQTTQTLKRECELSNGGTIYVNIPDTELGIKGILVNGCHMIDTLRFICGDLNIIGKVIRPNKSINDIESITALCENKKWKVMINAHNLIPANFGITVNSDDNVFELKPIEKLTFYNGIEVIEPTVEEPIRRYVPKQQKKIVETTEFKPGFNNMYKSFKDFCNKNQDENLCSVEEAKETLEFCWKLIDGEILNNFNGFSSEDLLR